MTDRIGWCVDNGDWPTAPPRVSVAETKAALARLDRLATPAATEGSATMTDPTRAELDQAAVVLDDIRLSHSTRFIVHLAAGTEIHGVRFPSGRVICDDPIEGLQVAASVEYLIEPLDVSRVEWVPEVAGAELEQLRAARDRTIDMMEQYKIAGSRGVHPRQVINLLSLTWPGGNYEAAPEAAQ
jgi:hypothetical protein